MYLVFPKTDYTEYESIPTETEEEVVIEIGLESEAAVLIDAAPPNQSLVSLD